MLTTRQQSQSNSPMITRVLVVIPQAIHVLISSLAVTHPTREWPESTLSLTLNLPQIVLRDVREVRVRQ